MSTNKEKNSRSTSAQQKELEQVEPYLTTDEAAAYLGYQNASALRNLIQRGHLSPSRRRGPNGPYLFTIEELEKWLRDCASQKAEVTADCE